MFFCSSIAFWMDAISVFRDVIVSCFSVIWDATSDLGRFLLPFVLAIIFMGSDPNVSEVLFL